ncbi:MAG: hypothetical protein KKH94_13515 [Candidatus Omnitrophica bacterium]|nr:hypothetical protein [Candidatus Omnitrophota bacterium]
MLRGEQVDKLIKGVFTLFLFILCILFFAQKMNFVTADLGRHLVNGKLFCEEGKVPVTNFYSYTEPKYRTVTHHWASGIIFYQLWKIFGFTGLSFVYVLISFITFYLFFTIAQRNANFSFAYVCALLVLPLIAYRTDIRPEGFSNLFLGIYFFLLYRIKKDDLSVKWLYVLPLLQFTWVNLHVFFPLGLFLIFLFGFDAWLQKKDFRPYVIVFCCAVGSCFINPFGLEGVLTPFTIFKNYGYMVAENQSLLFMQERMGGPLYIHFQVLCGLVGIGVVMLIVKKEEYRHCLEIILILFFCFFAWHIVRALPLFGYFFMPIAAHTWHVCAGSYSRKVKKWLPLGMCMMIVILLIRIVCMQQSYYSPFQGKSGLGLLPGVHRSAQFVKQNNIDGPIFNNYDIGGYLIFHLFPHIRPFVDNRPEAYSVSFFKEIYIPMQEDEAVWGKMSEKVNFNCIYFYRYDSTPWAQPFLIRRLNDPQWAPVFVDDYTLILIRRNKKNTQLIQKYELPKEIFRVRKT